MTHRTIDIDPDISVTDLLESWVNGNRSAVINALASDHAGLTALFIGHGITTGLLSRSDVNRVTNLLVDRRIEALG